MKFRVQTPDSQAAELQHRSVERLRLALRRLRWLVARVDVRLEHTGPSSLAASKRCSVEVTTRGVGRIVVSATAQSWQESVQIVATRVRQSVVARFRHAVIAGPADTLRRNAGGERMPRRAIRPAPQH
jgi:hypothetical protein